MSSQVILRGIANKVLPLRFETPKPPVENSLVVPAWASVVTIFGEDGGRMHKGTQLCVHIPVEFS